MTYLDANAAERLRPAARDAMLEAAELGGNPYSVHAAGRAARRIMEDARERLAAWAGCAPADLVFTSGGTEANALAVHALRPGRRVAYAATEHDAVRDAAAGGNVLPVGPDGRLRLDALAEWLAGGGPALVCVMAANNETGTVQPVAEAFALCESHGALLHCDAVAASGRVLFPYNGGLAAHSLAVSSGKMGGPSGAGFVAFRPGLHGPALFGGGGQERGRRGGTPALPAVAGMAAAAGAGTVPHLAALRDAAEAAAAACGAAAIGAGASRLPNTASLALPGVPAATQVIALDLVGVQVSAGAACSSGKVARSHVLDAMGLGSLAGEAIRVSLPWDATEADIHAFAGAYRTMAARMSKRRAA